MKQHHLLKNVGTPEAPDWRPAIDPGDLEAVSRDIERLHSASPEEFAAINARWAISKEWLEDRMREDREREK